MNEWQFRLDDMIRRHLGAAILNALGDPDIEEVQVNPDMSVHFVSGRRGAYKTDAQLQPSAVETFLRTVAKQSNMLINPEHPSLATTLPRSFGKCRIQGFLPPITEAPAFILRKPPGRIIELGEYVTQGALTEAGKTTIEALVMMRANIIVAGPTASGKTTLCNAVLAEVVRQFPAERILILEDTPELHIVHENHLRMQTTPEHSMRHLVKYSLRSTPRRIIVGEVRDHAARDLLDAWITGHPGGCGTVHGEDAQRALDRLASLAQEATPGVDQRRMVAQAVQAVIFIAGHGRKRRVQTLARVRGLRGDVFDLEELSH